MSDIMIWDASSREMHEIELLAALDARMATGGQYLEARLRMIPHGWRDWRMLAAVADRLIRMIYKTLPDRQLRHMTALAERGEAVIRLKGPADRAMQPVLLSDLEVLINAVVGAECSMCLKDGPEVKRCELRKALMNIATPADVHTAMCPYTQVAVDVHDGNYVARR